MIEVVIKQGGLFTAHKDRNGQWVDFRPMKLSPQWGMGSFSPDQRLGALTVTAHPAKGMRINPAKVALEAVSDGFYERTPWLVATSVRMVGIKSLDGTEVILTATEPRVFHSIPKKNDKSEALYEAFKAKREAEQIKLQERWDREKTEAKQANDKFIESAYQALSPNGKRYVTRYARNGRAYEQARAALSSIEGFRSFVEVNGGFTMDSARKVLPADVVELIEAGQ